MKRQQILRQSFSPRGHYHQPKAFSPRGHYHGRPEALSPGGHYHGRPEALSPRVGGWAHNPAVTMGGAPGPSVWGVCTLECRRHRIKRPYAQVDMAGRVDIDPRIVVLYAASHGYAAGTSGPEDAVKRIRTMLLRTHSQLAPAHDVCGRGGSETGSVETGSVAIHHRGTLARTGEAVTHEEVQPTAVPAFLRDRLHAVHHAGQ